MGRRDLLRALSAQTTRAVKTFVGLLWSACGLRLWTPYIRPRHKRADSCASQPARVWPVRGIFFPPRHWRWVCWRAAEKQKIAWCGLFVGRSYPPTYNTSLSQIVVSIGLSASHRRLSTAGRRSELRAWRKIALQHMDHLHPVKIVCPHTFCGRETVSSGRPRHELPSDAWLLSVSCLLRRGAKDASKHWTHCFPAVVACPWLMR